MISDSTRLCGRLSHLFCGGIELRLCWCRNVNVQRTLVTRRFRLVWNPCSLGRHGCSRLCRNLPLDVGHLQKKQKIVGTHLLLRRALCHQVAVSQVVDLDVVRKGPVIEVLAGLGRCRRRSSAASTRRYGGSDLGGNGGCARRPRVSIELGRGGQGGLPLHTRLCGRIQRGFRILHRVVPLALGCAI